jgi:hypothetical protein
MSEVGRRFTLLYDDALDADLDRCQERDRYAYARVLAFLDELEGDTNLCEGLILERYSDPLVHDVEPFWYLQDQRLNVYRVKLVEVGAWRLLTAGDHRTRLVAILALMHRDQNYERDQVLIARLKDSYERLGFHELGR